MPEWIQPISNILPLTYFAEGLRDSMVYETSIFTSSIWFGFGNMIIWGAVAFTLGLGFIKENLLFLLKVVSLSHHLDLLWGAVHSCVPVF